MKKVASIGTSSNSTSRRGPIPSSSSSSSLLLLSSKRGGGYDLVYCLIFLVVFYVLTSINYTGSATTSTSAAGIDANIEKSLEGVIERGQYYIRKYRHLSHPLHQPNVDTGLTVSSSNSNRNPSPHTNTNSNVNSNVNGNVNSNVNSNVKGDIVIGIGQDLDPKNFAVFCKSLRVVSPAATIVVFMNQPVNDRNSEIAVNNDVDIIEYSIEQLPQGMSSFHPSTTRYHLFYNYFLDEDVRELYSNVFMIDVRDAYFQRDPFKAIKTSQLQAFHVFTGVTTVSIGKCGWNGKWVEECFGNQVLNDIGNNNIICSGVSLGTMTAVFDYLVKMNDIITGAHKTDIGQLSKFPTCERNGVDQGAHNVLVYKGAIPQLKIWDQIEGPVSNMQAGQYELRENVVYNRKGAMSAVVHQYDRNQVLQRHLFKKYVYWTNTDDPIAEWRTTEACNKFDASWNVDLFSGICDLSMRGGATSPSSCCSFCTNTQGCKSFTYFNGKCFLKSCSGTDGATSSKRMKDAVSGFLKI